MATRSRASRNGLPRPSWPRPSPATGTPWSVRPAAGDRDPGAPPRGAGRARSVAILAEYDALRGLGHGCGHNLISAAGVGAAIALGRGRSDLRGEIVFLGTPAEEDLAGKQVMLDDGLFDGVDAAMMIHASNGTQVQLELLASVDAEIRFTGLQAHASTDPFRGRNALDGVILLFNAIGLWRQQLRTDARVHGIITDGGAAVNIIPGARPRHVRLRTADDGYHAAMRERLEAMVAGGRTRVRHRGDDPLVRARPDDAP